jgi:arylsulfatase A-like enzyme
MNVRQAVLSMVLVPLVSTAAIQAASRPNVLFIAIDDLVPTVGAYGDAQAVTPAMDTLASRGTTFLNHHVQWPVCGPSRAALTTGLLPEETGVMGFRPIRAILPEVITFPQHFRNNGYETAATGKFHDPRTVGNIVDPDSSTTDGRDIDDVASWSIPYVRAANGYSPSGKPAVDASDRPDSDYGDHKILVEGKDLLDTLEAGDKPFLLAVGFKKPHLPFVAPKKYWDFYDRDQFAPATFQDLPDGATGFVQDMLLNNGELLGYEPFNVSGLPSTAEALELIHGYYACASFIDALIDELLDHLSTKNDPMDPSRKMSETTIVILWGDHGFHLGDHGKWAKHSVMERSTLAPLIIYDPRNPANGVKTSSPVNTVDLYPTLCELAGLPVPEQPFSDSVTTGRPLKGRSIVPLLRDATASVNSGALTYIQRSGSIGYAFRTDRYRYIEWVNGSNAVTGRDLYDYKTDPMETKNLISNPDYATVVYQLSRAMRAEPIAKGAFRLINSDPIPASGAEINLGEGYVPTEEISVKKKTQPPSLN